MAAMAQPSFEFLGEILLDCEMTISILFCSKNVSHGPVIKVIQHLSFSMSAYVKK